MREPTSQPEWDDDEEFLADEQALWDGLDDDVPEPQPGDFWTDSSEEHLA